MKKKIGFDGKRALNNLTGLGNYSRFVIEALTEFHPDHQYYIYTPRVSSRFSELCRQLAQKAKIVQPVSALHRKLHALWRSYFIKNTLRRDRIDVFHGLSNELPFGLGKECKKIVTIHDLIFLRYPKLYGTIDRMIYKMKFRYACRTADHIIAVSEVTKRDIVSYFNIHPAKISVISMSCDEIFYKPVEEDALRHVKVKYALPDNFILCVGTLEERKNQLLLLKVFAEVRQNLDIKLVFIGRKTLYFIELESLMAEKKLDEHVQFITEVDWADLPAIYRCARVFAYPSIFEGFGIPVLEAMTCGVPVITTRGTSMEGIGQQACLYFENNDEADLARQLLLVLGDEAMRESLIFKGIDRAAQYDRAVIARQLINVYNS